MDSTIKQELPPAGGYTSINYKRVPAKQVLGGKGLIAGYFGITTAALCVFHYTHKIVHQEQLEKRSAEFVLYPLLLAERDREYLKQLRRNRDEESDLMKNVEGWKVGTYYGQPIYQTVPEDTLIEPRYWEYFIHASDKDANKRGHFSHWC